MPLPLILWGAAAALAATGVVKGAQAVGTMSDAEDLGKSAERRYRNKKNELEEAKEQTNAREAELAELRVHVFSHQIKHIVEAITRSIEKGKSTGSSLEGFNSVFSVEEMKQMKQMVVGSLELESGLLAGTATGALAGFGAYTSVGMLAAASTGTAISTLTGAAATNATLAWLGGGSLAAGGFGMAGGMIALGGIIAGPALAVGGFMLSSKAEEALTNARKYRDEVDVAIEQMELIETAFGGIRENADIVTDAIQKTVARFEKIKVFDNSDEAAFNQMLVVGKALKKLLETSTIDKEGAPALGIKRTCDGLISC
jgi:hypothetical protein